jgi:multiple sugar transport system permease protein
MGIAQPTSWRQRQRYAWLLGLSPSLVVLTLLTLVPAARC